MGKIVCGLSGDRPQIELAVTKEWKKLISFSPILSPVSSNQE
jgi:hypothetical protein